ncbi:MAG: NusA-like transcription termination signal-binding factor [Promethearchaeota archaeon]
MGRKIVLDEKAIQMIRLFSSFTGAMIKDCVFMNDESRVIFVIPRNQLGIAIGKGGVNIRRMKEKLNKDIDVVAYSDKLETFIKNILMPAKVTGIEMDDRSGRKTAVVFVAPEDKGIAIGKQGRNIAKTKLLVRRHFDVADVIISSR